MAQHLVFKFAEQAPNLKISQTQDFKRAYVNEEYDSAPFCQRVSSIQLAVLTMSWVPTSSGRR